MNNFFRHKISAAMVAGALSYGVAGLVNAEAVVNAEIAPPQLHSLIKQGVVTVIETFEHDAFTGWLVENSGDYHLYWATPDNYVVAGPLIDKNGINITAKYLKEKKPTPNFDAVFERFEKQGGFFSTKPDSNVDKGALYVFVEPFCGWCSKLHSQLLPLVEQGLEVRYVPVAFLSAKSPGVVEAIMSSDNPAAAYDLHEATHRTQGPVTKPVTAATREMLESNNDFMKEFGFRGTPGIVYQLDGKTHIGGFMQPDELSELAERLKAQQ